MKPPIPLQIQDEQLWMSADRALFWEKEKALIVSDTHLGKTGHFRKSGIGVPQRLYTEDLQRLLSLILYFKAEQLIVVGDLTHSHSNRELELFSRWRNDFAGLTIHLVRGNHDILQEEWYRSCNIRLHPLHLQVNGFLFRHEPSAETQEKNMEQNDAYFVFNGHLHPGVRIRGMGKQALRFPCFHFSDSTCTLPAFSRFTGLASIQPRQEDVVYAIVEDSIIRVQ